MNRRQIDFTLGVVMLDTRFPRPVGDIGNPATFPCRTLYRRLTGVKVEDVIVDAAVDPSVADAVLLAASELAAEGADMIATSCGFLAPLQDRAERMIPVPTITSALILAPEIRRRHAPAPIGILTFDSRYLTPARFGSHIDPSDVIEGIEPDGELHHVIRNDRMALDTRRAAQEVVAAAYRLIDRSPDIGAILFECTNFSPYRDAVIAATGRPVFDITASIREHAARHRPLGSPARTA
jgi:hypothetical protein